MKPPAIRERKSVQSRRTASSRGGTSTMRRAAALLAIMALLALPATAFAAEPFTADLTVDAEVPPVATPSEGSGSAEVTISDDGSEITYEVTYQDLTGDATA